MGRLVAVGNIMICLGFAIGPATGSLLIVNNQYDRIIWTGVARSDHKSGAGDARMYPIIEGRTAGGCICLISPGVYGFQPLPQAAPSILCRSQHWC